MKTRVLSVFLCLALACSDGTPSGGSDTEAARTASDASPAGRPAGTSVSGGVLAAPVPTTATASQDDSDRDPGNSRRTAIVRAAEAVGPAVVGVNVVRRERAAQRTPWDFFFIPREYERIVQGYGSGFIVTPDGVIITNQHVTEGAEKIVVTTRNGDDYDATLLGEDPLTDIAVLKVDGHDLPIAPRGTSSDLLVGEWVVAIGNPFVYLLGNTEPTVTAGVVSAVGRNLLPASDQPGVYVGMIQTDAPINPGNSGGPLVNSLGAVVGVNSSIFSRSGGSIGIGFAIPIERALRVANELLTHGSVRRAWAGVGVAGMGELQQWKSLGGLNITEVAPSSPADRAGLRANDVLIQAGDHRMRTFLDWEATKLDVGPGDSVQVRYQRGGRERGTVLVMQDLPTSQAEKVSVLRDIQVITVTPAIKQERDLDSDSGVLIYDISEQAQRSTGLKDGDVIVRINRRVIQSADDVIEAIQDAAGRGAVRLVFERSGRYLYTDFYVR